MLPESIHRQFAAGLIDPEAPLPDGVVDPAGRPAPKRYSVYRNNVTLSLIEVLKSSYPAIMALIGEEAFTHVARAFARQHPPTSPVMLAYGGEFASHLSGIKELAHLPFLHDVALLEWRWLEAYHSADAAPLDAAQLSGIADDAWAEVRFGVHPALRLVHSQFPVVQLWAGARENDISKVQPGAETALITRPDLEVKVAAVSTPIGMFLEALSTDQPIEHAMETVQAAGDVDLQAAISIALANGAFASVK